MAAGQISTAIAQFQRAEEAFQAAQLPVPAAMARGYVALAQKALPESHLRGTESLATILRSLRGMESRRRSRRRSIAYRRQDLFLAVVSDVWYMTDSRYIPVSSGA